MKNVFLIVFLLESFCASAQIDFSKYLDKSSFSFLNNMDDHLDVDISWKMSGNVQVFMNEGLNFLQEGDLSHSITNLDQVINLDSLQWAAYYYRGIANKKTLRLDKAIDDFQHAARLNPLIPRFTLS